ncbi:GSCOCG00011964001-RA-CDS [Cotesia congregata]|nr:GSCOCG00011964001-RA-CDS [Cotesia congregata]
MCKTCHKEITFNQASPRGLGFKIAVICECGNSYINSGPMIDNAFEINRRLVAVMRLLGVGINGINLFCGLMDLASKFYHQTFDGCFKNLWTAAETVCKLSMQQAVNKEKDLTSKEEKSETNLTISGDSTWKKRGLTSRFGIVTLAGKYSKEILDSCVKSTYCQSCVFWEKRKESDPQAYEEWSSLHEEECDVNHQGSVSKMEVDSVKDMFGRSISKYGVKYSRYIGDGDSATHKGLLDLDPYDTPVQKLECYLHVKKRMGTRCRNLKKNNKKLGGRSKTTQKLTVNLINKLQKYYGLAIMRYQDNIDGMYKAI